MDIAQQQRLRKIQQAAIQGYFTYSRHAIEEMVIRSISRHEVETVLLDGTMIEHYPDRPEGEECLVMGRTETDRVLHVACSLADPVVVITAYEPDPAEWAPGFTTRKPGTAG